MGSPRSAEFIRLVRPRALPGSSPVQQGELSRFSPTPHTFADLGLNTPKGGELAIVALLRKRHLRTMSHPPTYPAMSHPRADPAVNAVAARMVGLNAADPSHARILELGCGSGHHLLPLAARWPGAELVGIDRDTQAIRLARELAAEAGLANVNFHVGDLEDGAGQGRYDFIIAHGVFSWVPDAVKLALLRWISTSLAPNGVAVVSFNVAAGWRVRMPFIAKARAIQQAGDGVEILRALEILREVCETDAARIIVDDIRAKGAAVLANDDFAPVCDPFSLSDFVDLAAHHNLRWLGESVLAENLPVGGANVDESAFIHNPVAMHHALDELGGRTFRSALLCRADATVDAQVSASVVSKFFLSQGKSQDEGDSILMRELESAAPHDVMAGELIVRHGPTMATQIACGIFDGTVAARTHPVAVCSTVPNRPRMDEFRLACARRKLPVVDASHMPCAFPDAHYDLLAQMDGTRTLEELKKIASPELAFDPWIQHLTERGFFGGIGF